MGLAAPVYIGKLEVEVEVHRRPVCRHIDT